MLICVVDRAAVVFNIINRISAAFSRFALPIWTRYSLYQRTDCDKVNVHKKGLFVKNCKAR